jgi:hypothetical protein
MYDILLFLNYSIALVWLVSNTSRGVGHSSGRAAAFQLIRTHTYTFSRMELRFFSTHYRWQAAGWGKCTLSTESFFANQMGLGALMGWRFFCGSESLVF